jgi:hypothetical protein
MFTTSTYYNWQHGSLNKKLPLLLSADTYVVKVVIVPVVDIGRNGHL